MLVPVSSMRKYSHSTPLFMRWPIAAARSIWRFSMMRGEPSTSLPSIQRSAASQPTSGFHGSWMRLSGSGIANMSESAGVMSSHAAKPAKPAPSCCMSPIARAGTSFARSTPKRSTKLTRKYLIPSDFATAERSVAMLFPPDPAQPGLTE